MDIIIRKPTDKEIFTMKTKPVWMCEVSEFDWHYDSVGNMYHHRG